MRNSSLPKRITAWAALAAAWATPQAATALRAQAPTAAPDTGYGTPYRDTDPGGTGTGMGRTPGRGGSSVDSAYGRDTLWSSPYEAPATPGTGLPNSPGSGWPGTGSPGSSGDGGTGAGGSGMGADTAGIPPALPRTSPDVPPRDSIGRTDWMERG